MRQSLITENKRGKKYRTPHVHVMDIEPRSVVCASIADTEDYDFLDPWDIADNDFTSIL